jgi:hypothetical protein
MSKAITIDQLLALCENEKKKGNGSKKIMISRDDEGNGYHELFFGISDPTKIFGGKYPPELPYGVNSTNLKEYVVLG